MQSLSVQSPSDQESTGRAPAPFPLREVMARFATGVVVLSVGGEHIHGMTANAFSSVSLDPPTVLCCVAHDAVMHRAIRSAGHFGVSVLGAGQEALARYFADKKRPLGPEQFDGLDWTAGPVTKAPLLQGATAWLECELSDSHDSGDHSIFVGDVVGATRAEGSSGLLFFEGGFRSIEPSIKSERA
ncbi:flavin reductase family protein [Streptomyces sviceus]|uniref:flavin reductase family protein n=1 Tax=Streptomyces sviceus TaxID=285530 RepID=UPI0036E17824